MMRADVYDQLKERLFAGELRTGQFVTQRELASLLGATMNPVREAIRQLEAEGLINVYAQRGIQIIEGGGKAINDAYEYRMLLELNAIRLFASTAPKEEIRSVIRKVEASLKAMTDAPGDYAVRRTALERDFEFHREIVGFQRNGIITKHYSLNAARIRLFRSSIGEPLRRLDVAAKEHLAILDACLRRNGDLAAKRLAQHINVSREHTLGLRPMNDLRRPHLLGV